MMMVPKREGVEGPCFRFGRVGVEAGGAEGILGVWRTFIYGCRCVMSCDNVIMEGDAAGLDTFVRCLHTHEERISFIGVSAFVPETKPTTTTPPHTQQLRQGLGCVVCMVVTFLKAHFQTKHKSEPFACLLLFFPAVDSPVPSIRTPS